MQSEFEVTDMDELSKQQNREGSEDTEIASDIDDDSDDDDDLMEEVEDEE